MSALKTLLIEVTESLVIILVCTLLLFVIVYYGATLEQKDLTGLSKFPGVLSAYSSWANGILRGEWGSSYDFYSSQLQPAIVNTFITITLAIGVSLIIALCFGLWVAYKPKKTSSFIIEKIMYFSGAIPVFVVAIVLYDLFYFHATFLIVNVEKTFIGNLPAYFSAAVILSIGSGVAGELTKVFTLELSRIINEPYILASRTRQAKVWWHIFRASIVPLSSTLLAKIPFFIGAGIVVERILNLRGLGYYIIDDAIHSRFQETMASTLIIVTMVVLTRLANKMIVVTLDPRMGK